MSSVNTAGNENFAPAAPAGDTTQPAFFRFEARSVTGATIRGTVEAGDERAAERLLASCGLAPLSVRAASRARSHRPRWGASELANFADSLAAQLRTGGTIPSALNSIARAASHPKLRACAAQIADDILLNGANAADAFRKHPEFFPESFCNALALGSHAGCEIKILENYRDATARLAAARRQLRQAAIYPAAVAAVATVVVLAMMIWFVPAMQNIYDGLIGATGGQLPLPTRMLLAASGFVTSFYGAAAGGALALAFVSLARWARGAGKAAWQRRQLDLPKIGGVLRHYHAARAARSMAMLANAVPIKENIRETARAATNVVYTELLTHVHTFISDEGATPAVAFQPFTDYMGADIASVCASVEADGDYELHFTRYADELDARVTEQIEKLTQLVQPLMIVVIGGIVGGIVIACYLPLFTLIGHLANPGSGR